MWHQIEILSVGNECHSIGCCETKIIFGVDLVKGKDMPKEVNHSVATFETEFKSKVANLFIRMGKSLWGTGHDIVLDSGFGYVPVVVQLKNKGLCSNDSN